jgi:hypothetical protein
MSLRLNPPANGWISRLFQAWQLEGDEVSAASGIFCNFYSCEFFEGEIARRERVW